MFALQLRSDWGKPEHIVLQAGDTYQSIYVDTKTGEIAVVVWEYPGGTTLQERYQDGRYLDMPTVILEQDN